MRQGLWLLCKCVLCLLCPNVLALRILLQNACGSCDSFGQLSLLHHLEKEQQHFQCSARSCQDLNIRNCDHQQQKLLGCRPPASSGLKIHLDVLYASALHLHYSWSPHHLASKCPPAYISQPVECLSIIHWPLINFHILLEQPMAKALFSCPSILHRPLPVHIPSGLGVLNFPLECAYF